jgi:HEAT repeat protein
MWWERNREYVVKMRSLLRRSTATTGIVKNPEPRDPMLEDRNEILETMRRLARSARQRALRAAAVMALGRMGGDEDAFFFLRLLNENKEATVVVEAAAVALGILPPLAEPTRLQARNYLRRLIRKPQRLPTRARGLTLLATGLRARYDPDLVLALLERANGRRLKSDETANLIYALGLTGHPLVVPEVIRAVRRGEFAGRELSDLQRAHAVQALALVDSPSRVRLLAMVLRSRKARMETQRSAVMVLARLLREEELSVRDRQIATGRLMLTFENGRDPTLRGYAALAIGGARPPFGVDVLRATAESGARVNIRPYCFLALGLAAREMDAIEGVPIRKFLLERLRETREPERAASASIALGLARAHEATDLLLERLQRKSSTPPLRGAAAQGLGLMEARSVRVMKALEEIAVEGRKKPKLLEDVVLALGLTGRRDVALKLIDLLRNTTSSVVHGRIIIALGHLDHGRTIEPLHTILKDKRERTIVREFAAVALAFMGDRRQEDLLFKLDAFFNLHATTAATHELMRLY